MTKAKLSYLYPEAPAAGTGREIFPGVHWLRLPLPFDLNHINLWLLEDRDGYTLIDTGVSARKTREAWEHLFKTYHREKPITRVIVTHYHPDHIGLAAWLCERFSPEFCLTAPTYDRANYLLSAKSDGEEKSFSDFYRNHGVEDLEPYVEFCMGYSYREIVSGLPTEKNVIINDQKIEIGDHSWRAIVAYGHAEGHLSLYCDELQLLISGDQVLPTISTNISVHANKPEADNLKLYMDSFQFFQALPEKTSVLPSHGKVFQGLHNRLEELQQHHDKELERVYTFCSKPCTTTELIPLLYGRKLYGLHQMLGFGEALAHLVYLENVGRLERIQSSDQIRYVQK